MVGQRWKTANKRGKMPIKTGCPLVKVGKGWNLGFAALSFVLSTQTFGDRFRGDWLTILLYEVGTGLCECVTLICWLDPSLFDKAVHAIAKIGERAGPNDSRIRRLSLQLGFVL